MNFRLSQKPHQNRSKFRNMTMTHCKQLLMKIKVHHNRTKIQTSPKAPKCIDIAVKNVIKILNTVFHAMHINGNMKQGTLNAKNAMYPLKPFRYLLHILYKSICRISEEYARYSSMQRPKIPIQISVQSSFKFAL